MPLLLFFPWEEFAVFFDSFPPILTEENKVRIMSGREMLWNRCCANGREKAGYFF